jgi:uncharacterized protein YigE (DUF2233 family)
MSCRAKVPLAVLLFALLYSLYEVEARPRSATEIFLVGYSGKSFAVVKLDPKTADIKLFWKDPSGRPYKTIHNLDAWLKKSKTNLIAAMNAGMFDGTESRQPLGLHVENGLLIKPLNRSSGSGNFYLKPNGVFYIRNLAAKIVPTEQFSLPAGDLRLATQSGPLLVHVGEIHPRFEMNSRSMWLRSGVGIDSQGSVYWVHSMEPVTFYEFAVFFRDKLKCRDALYLDGAISRIYAPPIAPMPQHESALGGILAVVERESSR